MTWCSVDSATPRFDLASSAIRCRFVHRFVRPRVLLPCCPAVLSPRRPPSLGLGPGELSSPALSLSTDRGRYDFPTHASPVTYLFRFRGPRDPSLLRARCCQRSRADGGSDRARTIVQPAVLFAGSLSRGLASGTSQVLRRPILCLCPGPRPRPNRRSLADDGVPSMLPLPLPRQRLQHCSISGLLRASPLGES